MITYLNARNNEVSSSTASFLTGSFFGNPTPAFITVSVSAASVAENGAPNLVYTFTRTGSTAASLVANFAITGSTNSADFSVTGATSYTAGTGLGTVTFGAGSATTAITIDPTGDGAAEADESVVVDAGNSTTANGSFARALITNDDAPLFLVAAGNGSGQAVPLTDAELSGIAAAAIDRLGAAGASAAQLALLNSLNFQIVDFGGAQLGAAAEGLIQIDINGAGWGYYVDNTPYDDSEFALLLADGGRAASENSAAYGRIDLLSVVMHELGHVLGHDHDDEDGLMGATLETGVRHADLDALFADEDAVATLFS